MQTDQPKQLRITPYKSSKGVRALDHLCHGVVTLLLISVLVLLGLVVADITGTTKIFHAPKNHISEIQVDDNIDNVLTYNKKSQYSFMQKKSKLHHQHHPQVTIEKPLADKREYKYLKLDNNLKVLLVSDEDAKISQAALNVGSGSWNEPAAYPGLAHFLEHMLFQGSLTYPEENYFQKLISEGGGSTNAYTQGPKTNYYFSVSNQKLEEVLSVFAHFFIDPSLNANMVDREANAVNSEYEIDVAGDSWKLIHVLSLMSREEHPMSRFTIGNLGSLVKPDIVDQLRKFHENHYSANQMALVIQSSLPLSTLEKQVRESEFAHIPDKHIKANDYKQFGMPLKDVGSIVKYKLNKQSKTVLLTYELNDPDVLYAAKPMLFIDTLVKSRHEGGLHWYLTQELALGMDTAPSFLSGNGAFGFYLIQVVLNDNLEVLEVARAINTYFTLLQDKLFDEVNGEMKPTEYLLSLYEEKRIMSELQFKYSENPISTIFKLSHNLNQYPPQEVLKESVYEKFDPESIYAYLTKLRDPSNMAILIGFDGYKLEDGVDRESDIAFVNSPRVDLHSDLYRLDYAIKKIEDSTIAFIQKPLSKELQLPETNSFVPSDLSLKSLCHSETRRMDLIVTKNKDYDLYEQTDDADKQVEKRMESFAQIPIVFDSKEDCLKHEREYENDNPFPHLVHRSLSGRSWWRLNRGYNVPQVFGGLKFETAIKLTGIRDETMLSLFRSYMSETLRTKLQTSFQVGYNMDFNSGVKGMSMQLYGWSEKFPKFYEAVLETIKNADFEEQTLTRVRTALIQTFGMQKEDRLSSQAFNHYLPLLITDGYNPPEALAKEVLDVKREDLLAFQKQLLGNFRYTTFFTGNILRGENDKLTSKIKEIFNEATSSIAMENQRMLVGSLRGQSIIVPFVSRSADEQDLNGVTLNYYQVGHRDKKSFTIMNLLTNTFRGNAYNYLRTELQLGYIVHAGFRPVGCLDSAYILVQGTAKAPYEVNKHIEEFLEKFGDYLHSMPDSEFELIKSSTIAKLSQRPQTLLEEAQFQWSHIQNGDLAFEEYEIAADLISQIERNDVIKFYKRVFANKEDTGKLSLQIYGKGLITNTMGKSMYDFTETVEKSTMTNTYASQKEKFVKNEYQFKQLVRHQYTCGYTISNI